jgi:hypothetical protein
VLRPATVGLAAIVLIGCGDSDQPDGPADALAERVADAVGGGADELVERLDELGVEVDADDLQRLDAGDLRCPSVRDPDPGDRATCQLELADTELAIDVEFGADGAVTVVGVEAAP